MLKEFLKYVKSKRYVMLVLVLVMVVVYYFGTFFYMSNVKNINMGGLLTLKSNISADFSAEKVIVIDEATAERLS